MFQVTLVGGLIGYFVFLFNTFAIMSTCLFEYSVIIIFYAVYFGVLSRDMIDLASDVMASSLGVYFSLHIVFGNFFSITVVQDSRKNILSHAFVPFVEEMLP